MALAPLARQRRRSELSLGLLVVIIAVGGYILVALANGPDAAARPLRAARVGVRPLPRRAPRDPALRPVRRRDAAPARRAPQRHRLRHDRAPRPASARTWPRAVALGRDRHRRVRAHARRRARRARVRALPLHGRAARARRAAAPARAAASGARSTASRLWVAIGSITFEPSEIAKVLLVAFFAAYLVDKRELLTQGRVRIGR